MHTRYVNLADENDMESTVLILCFQEFKAASAQPPPEMQISKGAIAFMFESSRQFTVADWAWNSDKKHEHEPKMWDDLVDNFSTHLEEVNEILAKKGAKSD